LYSRCLLALVYDEKSALADQLFLPQIAKYGRRYFVRCFSHLQFVIITLIVPSFTILARRV